MERVISAIRSIQRLRNGFPSIVIPCLFFPCHPAPSICNKNVQRMAGFSSGVGVIADAAVRFGREPRPSSRELPRRPTKPRFSGSQPPGAVGRDRYCRRAGPRPPARPPPADWRVSAQTAALRRLPGYRGRRARPGCGCGRAPAPGCRPRRSAGRFSSRPAAPPSCGGECRNRQA